MLGLEPGIGMAVRGDSFDQAALQNGPTFARPWIDFFFVNDGQAPAARDQSCERYFIGHGSVDCWPGTGTLAGQRCIRGGQSCDNHALQSRWSMWVAVP